MAEGLPHPIFLVNEALHFVGLADSHGNLQIPFGIERHVIYTWLFIIILAVLGWMATKKMSLIPRGMQNFMETLVGGLEDFVVQNMGEDGRKVVPLLATIFIFILFCNWNGLVPGSDAPTANINTNAAMAVFVFCYYQYWGFRLHGAHYVKHFMGPVWWLAWLIMPIEIISHLARPLSLTLRLFGNIRGEEIVLVLLFLLAPVVSTIPITFLFLILKAMQAFIFFMLSMMYLKGAFEEAH